MLLFCLLFSFRINWLLADYSAPDSTPQICFFISPHPFLFWNFFVSLYLFYLFFLLFYFSPFLAGFDFFFWFFILLRTNRPQVEKLFRRLEINHLSEGYKRAVNKIWGCVAKIGFLGQKTDISGYKKKHFWLDTLFWPRPGKVVRTKKYPFPKWKSVF